MTQTFTPDGLRVPLTILAAGPCVVTDVRTKERDGYHGVQVGFGTKRKLSKSVLGHLKGFSGFRYLREFRNDETDTAARGDVLDVSMFTVGDKVTVTATSKGQGFQGVVKRHGFKGHHTTHGTKDQVRKSGSIGATGLQRVLKGMRMAGHMGNERITVKGLEVIAIDVEKNLLHVKGNVPGPRSGFVMISASGPLVVAKEDVKEEAIMTPEVAEPLVAVEPTPEVTPETVVSVEIQSPPGEIASQEPAPGPSPEKTA